MLIERKKALKAIITVEYNIDGPAPPKNRILDAIYRVAPIQAVFSEQVDGTEDWCLEVETIEAKLVEE